MKILVPTKRVPDTDQRIRVLPDGSGIEAESLPFVINPFDAIAVEEALRIGESSDEDVEVIAVGIGEEKYETELRTALAMGADRAVLVCCDATLDPWNVARILCAMVAREEPDLILMGKQAVDDDANQTGQFTAALLDWPQATFASKIELADRTATVSRETDHGIEVVRVELPAVITTDLRLNEPRYASLPSILKARKKPIERIDVMELDVVIDPRIEILSMQSSATGRRCEIVADADALVDRLRNEVKVI